MTGHEGKEVTGSAQYCAVNKAPCGKANMTGDEGKEVIGYRYFNDVATMVLVSVETRWYMFLIILITPIVIRSKCLQTC